ncbi:Tripartite motif-containing protein 7-like isoform X2 [Aix galericulata]|nr:Tripartite motif-containing protein 7-like isoform X2 [Aix galericulata]
MGERLRAPATKIFGTHEEEEEEEKIQSHLQSLRKVLAEFLDWRVADEKRRLDYLETSEAERRRIGSEFERLRRLLDEKERAVLQRLAELDAAFEAAQAEKASRVAEEIARLHGLIGQLEAGRLPQDTGSSLSRYVAPHRFHTSLPCFEANKTPKLHPPGMKPVPPLPLFCFSALQNPHLPLFWVCYLHGFSPNPHAESTSVISLPSWNEARLQLPPELEKSLRSCRRQHAALEEALKELRDPGRPKLKLETGKILSTEEKAKGTPDPGSAPPQVLGDRKSVRWDEEQDKAREPQRCEEAPGALGCEGAAPRRCSWEVEDKAQLSGL